jgi:hypothetical protein
VKLKTDTRAAEISLRWDAIYPTSARNAMTIHLLFGLGMSVIKIRTSGLEQRMNGHGIDPPDVFLSAVFHQ